MKAIRDAVALLRERRDRMDEADRPSVDDAIEALEALPPLPDGRRKPSPFRKRERDAQVVRLHTDEGLTLTVIGERYGITRERVRQIVRRAGVPESVTRQVLEDAHRVDWECESCGKRERRTRSLATRHRTCSHECGGELRREHSDTELIEHLAGLAESLGHTPGKLDIDAAGAPYCTTYQQRFGSLRNAQRLAGLKPNRQGRRIRNGAAP